MPSDEYASVGGGGALKLKGAKVHKKKKKRDKADLEKNLSTGDDAAIVKQDSDKKKPSPGAEDADEAEDQRGDVQKTESERRFDEIRKKRVAESSGSRPELLKTHKERVEELNTYLSKLSEHHDMPKIGPG